MVYPASKHLEKTFQKLREILPTAEKDKPQVLLLAGEVTPFRNDTDRELLFRQESNFFYLTGCDVPQSFLVATSPSSKPTAAVSTLFIPKPTLDDLTWSVAPPTLKEAQESLDITAVSHPVEIEKTLADLLKDLPAGSLFHTLPRGSTLYPAFPDEHTTRVLSFQATEGSEGPAVTDAYLLRAVSLARLTKDEEEIELIRKANAISSRAHEVVMRVLGKAVKNKLSTLGKTQKEEAVVLPGDWLIEKEAEAEAIFVASCRREGSIHQAYLPIVAASTRASTLHYCCNDRDFAWGPVGATDHLNNSRFMQNGHGHAHEGTDAELAPQVLLIDAGCEWRNYASDITRTIPVGNGGKFNKEAGAIYDLVLEMQKGSFGIIKAGLHWDAVQYVSHRTLVKGFLKLGIFSPAPEKAVDAWTQEEEDAIFASGISYFFFPHGLGHSLGMDVHDVPTVSKPSVENTSINAWRSSLAPLTGGAGPGFGHDSLYRFLRLRLPLEAGMVVTVEPGVYFSPHLVEAALASPGAKWVNTSELERYRGMGGVRIEDVVVVTSDGYENLTTVKSERAWVESVCSGEI